MAQTEQEPMIATARRRRPRGRRSVLIASLMLLLAFVVGPAAAAPLSDDQPESSRARVAEAMAVQEQATDSMLERPGVVGTGVTIGADGEPVILVFLEQPSDAAQVPTRIDGIATAGAVTGRFVSLADCPNGATGRCGRPVPPGVSTGHPGVTAGTLGALLHDEAGNHFALSNNHIYANENLASIGDVVLQPAAADGGSAANPSDVLGTLTDYEPLIFCPAQGCVTAPTNTIDAAIAAVDVDAVSAETLCGWTPSAQIVPVGDLVPGVTAIKKCGRTTGLMSGTVTAVNVTADVQLRTGTARFVNQIVTTDIAEPGDSGALIVDSFNRPVALLFAGSTTTTLGNPVGTVLGRFGLSIDDDTPNPDSTAPAAPAGLTASADESGVQLDWTDNLETDLAAYRVHRGLATGGPHAKTGPDLVASSYLDTEVVADTTYFYVVTAVDSSGNESSFSLEVSATPTVAPPPPPPPPPPLPPPSGSDLDTIGLFDPTMGTWHLRGGASNGTTFFFGNPGDVPFMGDWDCDGVDTPGLYRQSDGFVYLRNTNSQGVADITFFFGNPEDVPLAGDFNGDGCDTVSIYRPSEARIYIVNVLGDDGGGLGVAELDFVFGDPGDKLFVGDFDDDGIDTVGLHRESTGLVYFRNRQSSGLADLQFVYGNPRDRIVAGDWTGDGIDTPAVFRPDDRSWYFRYANSSGLADEELVWGEPSWLPVAGRFGIAAG
jgi:hypothetical protein